ncbi:MAG: WbqC family protein [Saprospiraceae bacterium]|nr:WbqC family protein [Saprospiraceae bacterium]
MLIQNQILLELQYFPPVQYFTKLLHYDTIYIEAQEHYQKGSYRNRCEIAGANGILRLSIPLEKGKNEQQSIQEVRIAYHEPWQAHHWESIQSAYGNAPFFLHYADNIQPFYEKHYTLLWDWNWDLLKTIAQLVGIQSDIKFTNEYQKIAPPEMLDIRNAIHPKAHRRQHDNCFKAIRYPQVFEEKHGFLPNLSILDLLFCTGPEALSILHSSFANDQMLDARE